MALGLCSYHAEKDYAAALKEFSIAAATSPNEPHILRYTAQFTAGKDAGVNRS